MGRILNIAAHRLFGHCAVVVMSLAIGEISQAQDTSFLPRNSKAQRSGAERSTVVRTLQKESTALKLRKIASGNWWIRQLDGSPEQGVWGLSHRTLYRFDDSGLKHTEPVPCSLDQDRDDTDDLFVSSHSVHLSCGVILATGGTFSQARRSTRRGWETNRGPYLTTGAMKLGRLRTADGFWAGTYGSWERVTPSGLSRASLPEIGIGSLRGYPETLAASRGYKRAWALVSRPSKSKFKVSPDGTTMTFRGKVDQVELQWWLHEYDGIRWRQRALNFPWSKNSDLRLTGKGDIIVLTQIEGQGLLAVWSQGVWSSFSVSRFAAAECPLEG